MGLSITNNVASLTAQHNLGKTNNMMSKNLERLSSGLKINRGADGPAGLVISETQRAQISGLQAALENVGKAVNVVQTGEGALNEMNRLLVKIRNLAVDSANSGVNDSASLAANQSEISNALDTINNIARTTQFGSKKLLDGSRATTATVNDTAKGSASSSGTLASGTVSFATSTVAQRALVVAGANSTTLTSDEVLTINGFQFTIASGTTAGANQVTEINKYTANTGVTARLNGSKIELYSQEFGTGHKITVTTNGGGGTGTLLGDSGTTNVDGADITGTIAGVAAVGVGNVLTATSGTASGLSITVKANTAGGSEHLSFDYDGTATIDASKALVFQIGANANQSARISMDNMQVTAIGLGASSVFTSLSQINVTNSANSAEVLKVVDQAIADVSNLRGRLGAFQQNTLESTANNLRATLENTVAAESTIRDTDFASETASFTKSQVLLQAGTSVLQNANQTSQLVLGLLRG